MKLFSIALCSLAVGTVVQAQQPTQPPVPSTTSIETSEVLQLHGSGTTNPKKLIWKTMSILESRAKVPIRMTYRAVGSGTGQKEFMGEEGVNRQLGNFGAGDIPFSNDNYNGMIGRNQELMHIPFVMGAISFFHSIPSELPLDLNACLLAKIFNVQITKWDDDEILNYGNNKDLADVLAGQDIKVVRRVFGSSSTSIATKYIQTAATTQGCSADWPETMVGKGDADKKTLLPTKEPYWSDKTFGAQGSGGVATFLKDNAFAIGYLDAGHGIDEGLSEVAIQNKAGAILTSQKANKETAAIKSIEQGIIPTNFGADFSAVTLLDADGEDAWPMMTFSYFYIKKDMTSMGESGALVRALVQFVLSEEGQDYLAEFGFVKIPKLLVDLGTEAVTNNATYKDGIKTWEFESAASTIVYGGTADHIFSGKRQNWDTYVLSALSDTVDGHVQLLDGVSATTSAIDAVAAQVAELSTKVETSASQANGETGEAGSESDQDAKIDQSFSIGVAALVITLIYSIPLTVFAVKLNARVTALEGSGPQQAYEAALVDTTKSGPL